ncbi:MAG TPA: DUF6134 family protein [Flavitalea sp.]|nr:DUF6134 family protein [Flavitalea sp.]
MRIFKFTLILMMITLVTAEAQEILRNYIVLYKGEDIGVMQLKQTIAGDTVLYKMTSDIRTRFIFNITVKSVEESTFQNGKLVYSAVNRTVNGNQKVKRQTTAGNKVYTLNKEGKPGIIYDECINYNLMSLYCREPVNIARVYSDNYQQFLPITKINAHTYKIELPDGNYNHYIYNRGICVKVDVFNNLYNMELVLR